MLGASSAGEDLAVIFISLCVIVCMFTCAVKWLAKRQWLLFILGFFCGPFWIIGAFFAVDRRRWGSDRYYRHYR